MTAAPKEISMIQDFLGGWGLTYPEERDGSETVYILKAEAQAMVAAAIRGAAEIAGDPLTVAWLKRNAILALAASPEVQALVDAAVKAERERCVTALARACDAEIEQAKKRGPMHVPIIIAVKHDCIAAIRAGEGAT